MVETAPHDILRYLTCFKDSEFDRKCLKKNLAGRSREKQNSSNQVISLLEKAIPWVTHINRDHCTVWNTGSFEQATFQNNFLAKYQKAAPASSSTKRGYKEYQTLIRSFYKGLKQSPTISDEKESEIKTTLKENT